MRLSALCLILPALALAACNSGNRDAERAAAAAAQAQSAADAAAAAAPAPVQMTGDALARFDLIKGPAGQLVGTFARTGPATWTGPYPTTGQPVEWSASPGGSSITLYTDNPRITTIVLHVDTADISSSAMDPQENFQVTNLAFQ